MMATVAKEIELEDKFENMGGQMVKEVATRPPMSPVTVNHRDQLAQAIAERRVIGGRGANPMDLKRG
jgi:hypothetical protein